MLKRWIEHWLRYKAGFYFLQGEIEGLRKSLNQDINKFTAHKHEEKISEFDCPLCKHKTCCKEVPITTTSSSNKDWTYFYLTSTVFGFYCYGCGKTFTKSTEAKWVEVQP